ncbi:MAG: DUF1735 domain-containing protein [Bacteroidales bacterium]|nr:DUF1735 domain-containing protein [Bacteroidales bacterium]
MKKRIFTVLAAALVLVGCHNFDTDFPDYKYTTGYFPYQFPVRTIVLGNDQTPNDNDNAGKFVISAAMGGVYKNNKDRVISFKVDESLADGLTFANGDPIKALPASYYTLSNTSQITIPKGEYNGGVTVQLNDAFFNDPDAIKNTYIVPLIMTGTSDLDSLLLGQRYATIPNPDLRLVDEWLIPPKNFTMFGVKFITELHGHWFHYGSATVTAAGKTETVEYKEKDDFNSDVTGNEVVMLTTTGRHTSTMTQALKGTLMDLEATLVFTQNGESVTISAPADADYTVTGSGTYKLDTASPYNRWSNKDRYVLTYSFTLTDASGNTYKANDTLVARDRDVKLETYVPKAL